MRARWLVALAVAMLAAALLGGPASGAPPKKCPKSKVTRVVNGTKACVPAARFRARAKPPSPAASLVRDSLTRTVPGLRRRPGRALPRTIPPRLARQIAARFPAVEAKLAADVQAARAQASTARSDAVAVTGTSLSSSADGSSTTGRINMRAGEGGSAVDVAASLTATASGKLDVGVDVSSRTASGSRLTKGITVRDILAGEAPRCPTGTDPLSVRGGVDATARTEEVFDSGRAKLGTVREASTVKVTSSARAGINPDGGLQPIAVTVGVSVDHARSAQGLAFFQSRQRAVARGTMTATVDPTTGRISNARVTSTGKASGFDGDAAAADAAFTVSPRAS